MIYVTTTISTSQDNTHANRLANTLSSDKNQHASFADYFQDKSSGLERQATQKQIVEILNQDEAKLNAFFAALDNIFQQESFTQTHYGPIEDIVGALNDASNGIFDKVSSLANKSDWGDSLLHLLELKDFAVTSYDSFGSSSNSQASAIEDPQEAPVILQFNTQNKAS